MVNHHTLTSHIFKPALLTLLIIAGSVAASSAPRVLPQQQAAHFCRLFVNDGEGSTYTMKVYARNFMKLFCEQPTYGDYSAEQVFTGLIFFYEDWIQDPLIAESDYDHQMLAEELHSGATLRVFPYQSENGIVWYAPTDDIPLSIDAEHRKYMQEVFSRLNSEVHAQQWPTVDAYIDRMIQYQCKYGAEKIDTNRQPVIIPLLAVVVIIILAVFHFLRRKKTSAILPDSQ